MFSMDFFCIIGLMDSFCIIGLISSFNFHLFFSIFSEILKWAWVKAGTFFFHYLFSEKKFNQEKRQLSKKKNQTIVFGMDKQWDPAV